MRTEDAVAEDWEEGSLCLGLLFRETARVRVGPLDRARRKAITWRTRMKKHPPEWREMLLFLLLTFMLLVFVSWVMGSREFGNLHQNDLQLVTPLDAPFHQIAPRCDYANLTVVMIAT